MFDIPLACRVTHVRISRGSEFFRFVLWMFALTKLSEDNLNSCCGRSHDQWQHKEIGHWALFGYKVFKNSRNDGADIIPIKKCDIITQIAHLDFSFFKQVKLTFGNVIYAFPEKVICIVICFNKNDSEVKVISERTTFFKLQTYFFTGILIPNKVITLCHVAH